MTTAATAAPAHCPPASVPARPGFEPVACPAPLPRAHGCCPPPLSPAVQQGLLPTLSADARLRAHCVCPLAACGPMSPRLGTLWVCSTSAQGSGQGSCSHRLKGGRHGARPHRHRWGAQGAGRGGPGLGHGHTPVSTLALRQFANTRRWMPAG